MTPAPSRALVAGLIPLAAVPLAVFLLQLLFKSQPSSDVLFGYLEDIQQSWTTPVFAIPVVLASAYCGRAVLAAVRDAGVPAAVALLPVLLQSAFFAVWSFHEFGTLFKASTHCGPLPREVLYLHFANELVLGRAFALVTMGTTTLCVSLALLWTVRAPDRIGRVGLALAVLTLAASFMSGGLAEFAVLRTGVALTGSAAGREVAVIASGLSRWREFGQATNTLLLAAVVIGLGSALKAGVRRESLLGLMNAVVIAVVGLGVRGANAIDVALVSSRLREYGGFTGLTRAPEGLSARRGGRLESVSSSTLHGIDDLYNQSGLPLSQPVYLAVGGEEPRASLEDGLRRTRAAGLSRVVLLLPQSQPSLLPGAFAPISLFQGTVHELAPLEIWRPADPPCADTATITARGLDVQSRGQASTWVAAAGEQDFDESVWGLPCVELTGPYDFSSLPFAARTAAMNRRHLVVRP